MIANMSLSLIIITKEAVDTGFWKRSLLSYVFISIVMYQYQFCHQPLSVVKIKSKNAALFLMKLLLACMCVGYALLNSTLAKKTGLLLSNVSVDGFHCHHQHMLKVGAHGKCRPFPVLL